MHHDVIVVGVTTAFDERWLGSAAAANRLGVQQRTLYKMIDGGGLPAYRIGRVIRLRERDVDPFIESCRVQPGRLGEMPPDGA